MSGSAFEDEVRQVAAVERVTAPRVTVDVDVKGRAATPPSGRLVRVHPEVLSYPEPAQRWLAAHEMRHVLAHRWSEPGTWVGRGRAAAGLGVVGAVAWSSPFPPEWMLVTVIWGLVGVYLLGLAGTSWWSRRLEADADQYAARDGRLEALDEASLLELLIGRFDAPLWLSSHPRWLDRIPVAGDRLPAGIRSMQAELGQAVAQLDSGGRSRRRRSPALVMVRRLPGDRVVLGRWQRVVVAQSALSTPAEVPQPQLVAAVVQARRLPRLRAATAGGTAFLGLLAAAVAAVVPTPERAVQTATIFGVVLLLIAGYEVYRRAVDRRLLRAATR